MSDSLDPDQAQHFIGPDLRPNIISRSASEHYQQTTKVVKEVDVCVLESNIRYCYSVVIDVFVNDSSMKTEDKKLK